MNKILTACFSSNPKQFNLIMVQKKQKNTNIYTYAPLVLQEFHSIIKVTVSLVRSLAIRACLKISKEINDLRCLIGQLLYINSITGVHGMHCDMKARTSSKCGWTKTIVDLIGADFSPPVQIKPFLFP